MAQPSTPLRGKGAEAEFPLTMAWPDDGSMAPLGRVVGRFGGEVWVRFADRTELYDSLVVTLLARELGLQAQVMERQNGVRRVRLVERVGQPGLFGA